MKRKQFLRNFQQFLETTNVNLGRKSSRRREFIDECIDMVDSFLSNITPVPPKEKQKEKKSALERCKAFLVGQKPNTFVMTAEASQKADELLKKRQEKRKKKS